MWNYSYTRVLIEFSNSRIRKGCLVHLHDHQPTELERHMQQALRSIVQIRRMDRQCLEHGSIMTVGHMTPYLR